MPQEDVRELPLRKVAKIKDGRKLDVEIYRLGDDWKHMKEKVVDHMVYVFSPRETINTYSGITEDAESMKNIRELWNHVYDLGISLGAFIKENNEYKLVGCNMLYISQKDSKEDFIQGEGEKFILVGRALLMVQSLVNVHEAYGVDKYLSAIGLSVDLEYCGLGLGYEILMSRDPLCRQLGLTVATTIFTGPISQHLGRKAGYVPVAEVPYNEIVLDGKNVYPDKPGILSYTVKKIPASSDT